MNHRTQTLSVGSLAVLYLLALSGCGDAEVPGQFVVPVVA